MTALQQKRLGLALGGGAARGLAHVGVVQVLAEAGIEIHAVAGASAGAMIGAAVAAGRPASEIMQIGRGLGWWKLARPRWPRRGFLTFAPLERLLRRWLGDVNIEDLPTPFACVATHALSGQVRIFRTGKLAPRVRASCSVPVVVQPVEIEGELYVDGGLIDNVPVNAVRDLGVDVVVAVNLFGPPAYLPSDMGGYAATVLGHMLVHADKDLPEADLIIQPNLTEFGLLRFHRDPLIARGRQAAEQSLPEIRRLLQIR